MGEKRDTTGKRVRPKTAVRGKRYLCARCRKRSPTRVTTPAPWYCPNCLRVLNDPGREEPLDSAAPGRPRP